MVGEIEGILEALNQARVRYLVVGGVAVVLHGYLRTTADLDLIVQLDRDNVLRAIRALQDYQYRPRAPVSGEDFAESAIREQWIRDKEMGVEIDLFASEPVDFDMVYARALRVPLEKTEATVIAFEDLIALKRSVGRPRDLEDVAALESLTDKVEESKGHPDA